MKKPILILLALLMTALAAGAGCSTGGKHPERHVSNGMTKKEVYEKLGDPESVKTEGGQEILTYHYNDKAPNGAFINHEYHVILQDGKVAKYERADFKE